VRRGARWRRRGGEGGRVGRSETKELWPTHVPAHLCAAALVNEPLDVGAVATLRDGPVTLRGSRHAAMLCKFCGKNQFGRDFALSSRREPTNRVRRDSPRSPSRAQLCGRQGKPARDSPARQAGWTTCRAAIRCERSRVNPRPTPFASSPSSPPSRPQYAFVFEGEIDKIIVEVRARGGGWRGHGRPARTSDAPVPAPSFPPHPLPPPISPADPGDAPAWEAV
jgi:hypothetical protein